MASVAEIMRRQCALVLDDEFMATVKISQLLYSEPFLGVLVTEDDAVHAIGADTNNFFGLGKVEPIPRLTRLEALCGQKIRSFSAGANHVLALSEGGVVYAWGYNSTGQLGDGSTTNSTIPIVVAGDLTNQVVREVAAGGNGHSLALTDDGKVYSWGSNTCGQTGQERMDGNTPFPKQVVGLVKERIVKIIADSVSAVCLSDTGRIFTFGHNGYGQLGIGHSNNSSSPVRVEGLRRYFVEKVRCEYYHTFALTNSGVLFAWGANENGQLGTGSTTNHVSPTRINFSIDESFNVHVMDISIVMKHRPSAVDVHGETYIWGSVNGGKVLRPTKSTAGVTDSVANLKLRNERSFSDLVNQDLVAAFDDKITTDFVITIKKKNIHVHKAVLQIRSEYFRTMFSGSWKETNSNKAEIEHYSYEVYHAFLKYIYSGKLEKIETETALKLLDLAHCALDEPLMKLCGAYIRKTVTFENVARIFSLALTLDQKELVDFCVKYAMRDMASVVRSDAFTDMSSEHIQTLFRKGLDNGLFAAD